MRSHMLAAATLLAAGAVVAFPGVARDRGVPAATPAGPAVTCIPLNRIRSSHVRSDDVIDFEMNDRTIYRVTLPNGCPNLGFEERFAYRTSLSQLCSTDIITVLYASPTMTGASCGLDTFQPVVLADPRRR